MRASSNSLYGLARMAGSYRCHFEGVPCRRQQRDRRHHRNVRSARMAGSYSGQFRGCREP
jgi:hypothetical protein